MEIYHEKSHKRNNNVSENQKFYILKVETIELFIAETCIESYWIRWHFRTFDKSIHDFSIFFPLKTRQHVCQLQRERVWKKSFWNKSRSQFHFAI